MQLNQRLIGRTCCQTTWKQWSLKSPLSPLSRSGNILHHQNFQSRLITDKVSKVSSQIDSTFHPKIQTLLIGFAGGMIFTSLYNKEIPGHYRRLLRRAKKGNSSAQVELGEYLLDEANTSQNINLYKKQRLKKRAFQWFASSADQGNQRAHYWLGMLHLNKDLEASNEKAAFYHFNCAALNDNATNEMHEMNKNEIKTNASEMIKSNANYQVALCYLKGTGCNRNVDKGLSILLSIGTNGNVLAAKELWQIYKNGNYGIGTNSTRCLSWHREAARLGDKQAQNEMTQMYINAGKDIIDPKIVEIDVFNTMDKEKNKEKKEKKEDSE